MTTKRPKRQAPPLQIIPVYEPNEAACLRALRTVLGWPRRERAESGESQKAPIKR